MIINIRAGCVFKDTSREVDVIVGYVESTAGVKPLDVHRLWLDVYRLWRNPKEPR